MRSSFDGFLYYGRVPGKECMDGRIRNRVLVVPPVVGQRFYTVPTLSQAEDEVTYKAFLLKSDRVRNTEQGVPIMRYAAYIRVSDEEQVNGYSLDAQQRIIREWVQGKGGTVVKVYADEGESAVTANRTKFQQMRIDARKSKFDAIIVHKFDRFARNRYDALAIKSLFRYDYKIKVFSCTEPSEDSDGVIGALIEGIMECVADWYSRNLANEVKKGKKERSLQGLHNNQAPFGYDKDDQKVLVRNGHEFTGLMLAFSSYATGNVSDAEVASLRNNHWC